MRRFDLVQVQPEWVGRFIAGSHVLLHHYSRVWALCFRVMILSDGIAAPVSTDNPNVASDVTYSLAFGFAQSP